LNDLDLLAADIQNAYSNHQEILDNPRHWIWIWSTERKSDHCASTVQTQVPDPNIWMRA
jgi:hypothetical protein